MAKETTTPTAEELEGMTKADLTKTAKKEGVEVTSHMTKAEIVDEIQAAQPAAESSSAPGPVDGVGSAAVDPSGGPEAVRDADAAARAALGR